MNSRHIRLIRKTVKELLETALAAEVAGMYPPEEAAARRIEHRMAKFQYNQMLKEFERECEPAKPVASDDDLLG